MPDEPSMLQVVLMGLITVFVVLICIILIIRLMSRLINTSRKNEDSALAQPVAASAAVPAPATGVRNGQLAAAVSVAIAENMGTDVSHLRIHSIAAVPALAARVNNSHLVAAVSAAIAESIGTDVSHLRIHSIKKR